jgi:hypothetical protein
MYENKFPTGYLKDYKPEVIQSGDTYIVDYTIGECVYTRYTSRSNDTRIKVGKRIKQEVLQLIKTDMWKVITEINERTPLSEKDYAPLNMEIRNHSLQYVEEFINKGPHPQTNSSTV